MEREADPNGEAADAEGAGPASGPSSAIAKALELAAEAGRWDVVAQLGKELEARRLARSGNVVALPVSPRRAR